MPPKTKQEPKSKRPRGRPRGSRNKPKPREKRGINHIQKVVINQSDASQSAMNSNFQHSRGALDIDNIIKLITNSQTNLANMPGIGYKLPPPTPMHEVSPIQEMGAFTSPITHQRMKTEGMGMTPLVDAGYEQGKESDFETPMKTPPFVTKRGRPKGSKNKGLMAKRVDNIADAPVMEAEALPPMAQQRKSQIPKFNRQSAETFVDRQRSMFDFAKPSSKKFEP